MKPTTKPLDQQGRIVVPRAMLTAIGVEPGEFVNVYIDNSEGKPALYIERHEETCVFCGSILEKGISLRGKLVCHDCIGLLNGFGDGKQGDSKEDEVQVNVWTSKNQFIKEVY